MSGVVLPGLPWEGTPNESTRRPAGVRPHLVVAHTWGNPPARTAAEATSRFEANVRFMQGSSSEVSAHVVYSGGLIPRNHRRAVQLVEWQRKAWTQAGANSFSYSVESADSIWLPGVDPAGFAQLARIFAYICLRSGIPPLRSTSIDRPGLIRHRDLGPVGNPSGHTDPTGDLQIWKAFCALVKHEFDRGGFRRTWGRGTWPRR